MRRWSRIIGALVALGSASVAVAQSDDESVRYNKTTTLDFEGDTIEGDLTRPDGEYVEARKRVNHSNLIRIREDFSEKVLESVGEL